MNQAVIGPPGPSHRACCSQRDEGSSYAPSYRSEPSYTQEGDPPCVLDVRKT